MWSLFLYYFQTLKITNMNIELNAITYQPNYRDTTEQIRIIQAYKAGAMEMQKEYEEKLRWIPVEEKLPEKIQKQPYITHVVQVKSTTFAEPLCAYYNHDHCVWLSYPFGNSAKLLTVTHWRYFL